LVPTYSGQNKTTQKLNLSFLIPARNEEHTILACLNSVLKTCANVDHNIEIIVVDDHSEDGTARTVLSLKDQRIKLIDLSKHIQHPINAYKKVALATGLAQVKGDYIIQLDADVVLGENYLECVSNSIINTNADLIAGPVILNSEKNQFIEFQVLDMLGMMAVTGAGIISKKWYMANGANLIYKKEQVQFADDNIASGDDIYTIQKIANDGNNKIIFIKDLAAAVHTDALAKLTAFCQQRIRWGTKNKYMSGKDMRLMMAIPYLNSIVLLLHLIAIIVYGPIAAMLALFHILSKMAIDFIYLNEIANHFKKETSLQFFFSANVFHILYLAFIGTLSLFKKNYIWKGRNVS